MVWIVELNWVVKQRAEQWDKMDTHQYADTGDWDFSYDKSKNHGLSLCPAVPDCLPGWCEAHEQH